MQKRKQMRAVKTRKQILLVLVIGLGALGAVALYSYNLKSADSSQAVTVDVVSATLSEEAKHGEVLFNANCAACHGENAAGTDLGPPLIHDIYNPGHHSDEAFYLAASIGTRQHHWQFGDMPPQPQVSREDVSMIIRFIREVQAANGIGYRPHDM